MNHIYITPQEYEEAAKIGIKPSQLTARVRQSGWDIQRAITTPMGATRKTRDHYALLAEKNGIAITTYKKRVYSQGWPKEKAATTPVRDLTDRSKWLSVAEEHGISRPLFYQRIHRYLWNDEKAATTPVTPNDGTRKRQPYKAGGLRDDRKSASRRKGWV